jgi:hypothetical protein
LKLTWKNIWKDDIENSVDNELFSQMLSLHQNKTSIVKYTFSSHQQRQVPRPFVSCSYASMPILHTIQQTQIYCGQAFVRPSLNLTCYSHTCMFFFSSHEDKIVINPKTNMPHWDTTRSTW